MANRRKGSKRRGVTARKKRKPAARWRSAITGRFVKAGFGRRHRSTTVQERS